MAGNISEWVNDRYDKNYYKKAPKRNPKGPTTGVSRVFRGGSWLNSKLNVFRTSARDKSNLLFEIKYVGFRCAKNIE